MTMNIMTKILKTRQLEIIVLVFHVAKFGAWFVEYNYTMIPCRRVSWRELTIQIERVILFSSLSLYFFNFEFINFGPQCLHLISTIPSECNSFQG